jgi:hypothetical protein
MAWKTQHKFVSDYMFEQYGKVHVKVEKNMILQVPDFVSYIPKYALNSESRAQNDLF